MHRRIKIHAAVCCFLFFLFSFATAELAGGESEFRVERIGQMRGFGQNAFLVHAPEDGVFSVTIRDANGVYRVIRENVAKGDTELAWDACGKNGEPLAEKYYIFDFLLKTEEGKEYSYVFESSIVENLQHLQFVLPSGGKASLEKPDDWFVEMKAIHEGTVAMELTPEDGEEAAYTWFRNVHPGRIEHFTLGKMAGKNLPEPGRYRARFYEISREDEATEFSLEITEREEEAPEVTVTGDIMPNRGADDSDIWAAMMRPSVVVDIDYLEHQKILAAPEEKAKSLGTLHGQSQGLEVMEISGEWARIGAWNHEEGEYVEGWVPLGRLKMVEPNPEYGILIDKKDQSLTLYHHGQRIERLLVSTGKMDKGHYDRETSAGCFLTGLHRVDFSTQGSKYDFVIQYDGGNLLHQIPYSSDGRRDFTKGKTGLGQKASHACIRIQDEPGEENGINAYWIWTHIPYRTRVIILDDPEERRAEKQRLESGN